MQQWSSWRIIIIQFIIWGVYIHRNTQTLFANNGSRGKFLQLFFFLFCLLRWSYKTFAISYSGWHLQSKTKSFIGLSLNVKWSSSFKKFIRSSVLKIIIFGTSQHGSSSFFSRLTNHLFLNSDKGKSWNNFHLLSSSFPSIGMYVYVNLV